MADKNYYLFIATDCTEPGLLIRKVVVDNYHEFYKLVVISFMNIDIDNDLCGELEIFHKESHLKGFTAAYHLQRALDHWKKQLGKIRSIERI